MKHIPTKHRIIIVVLAVVLAANLSVSGWLFSRISINRVAEDIMCCDYEHAALFLRRFQFRKVTPAATALDARRQSVLSDCREDRMTTVDAASELRRMAPLYNSDELKYQREYFDSDLSEFSELHRQELYRNYCNGVWEYDTTAEQLSALWEMCCSASLDEEADDVYTTVSNVESMEKTRARINAYSTSQLTTASEYAQAINDCGNIPDEDFWLLSKASDIKDELFGKFKSSAPKPLIPCLNYYDEFQRNCKFTSEKDECSNLKKAAAESYVNNVDAEKYTSVTDACTMFDQLYSIIDKVDDKGTKDLIDKKRVELLDRVYRLLKKSHNYIELDDTGLCAYSVARSINEMTGKNTVDIAALTKEAAEYEKKQLLSEINAVRKKYKKAALTSDSNCDKWCSDFLNHSEPDPSGDIDKFRKKYKNYISDINSKYSIGDGTYWSGGEGFNAPTAKIWVEKTRSEQFFTNGDKDFKRLGAALKLINTSAYYDVPYTSSEIKQYEEPSFRWVVYLEK